jgi:hypothetical protein
VRVRLGVVPATACGSANTAGRTTPSRSTFYRYDASGVLLGSQEITAALDLFPGGDEFESRSAIEILDVNDNVIGTGCATAVGKRFE